ncbi:unnamed protein product [Sphagnum balticum]
MWQGLDKFKKLNLSCGGTRFPAPTRNEDTPFTNGSFVLSVQGSRETPVASSSSIPRSSLSNEGKNKIQALEDSVAFCDTTRCQLLTKIAQATSEKSDGEALGGQPQRSSLTNAHPNILIRATKRTTKTTGRSSHTQVLPKPSPAFLRLLESFSAIVGQRSDQESSGSVVAARQEVREDSSVARAKEPSKRSDSKEKSNTPTKTPPNPALIAHPGSRPGISSTKGEESQGPSLVDYSLEIIAEFPVEMVLEMRGNAAKKARRIVLGRTLGGRATFKALQECLKLHLPATFISATLLTRGYFLVLFENEEGAIYTRKLTTVEWSGLSLSFSRYTPNFDTNAQGVKALLTHSIKVQFPDLHEQFRNTKAPTIMASKLGEVLDIEAANSYIKRPAGPMVTIEVMDITKLAGYIRIPSMAEGASATDTIRQRILYSGLPNQCQKCHKFGHHAQICNVNKLKPQEGSTHQSHLTNSNPRRALDTCPSSHGTSQVPQNREPFRARVWPVLARERNSRKETLVHSKNQAWPSFPLNIRLTGSVETKWTPSSAWADLTQRLEVELEEKVLRYKLSISDRPQLEWAWQEVVGRGGLECTILAHIDTGFNALSIQNKRHLHWKVLELAQGMKGMNNEAEFATPAHNLLMKTVPENSIRPGNQNRSASIQASPQAARKKKFVKLDIKTLFPPLFPPRTVNDAPLQAEQEENKEEHEQPTADDEERTTGSIGQPATRNKLSYD